MMPMAARFFRTPLLQPTTPTIKPATNTITPTTTNPGSAIEIAAPTIDSAIEAVDQSNPRRRAGGGATPELYVARGMDGPLTWVCLTDEQHISGLQQQADRTSPRQPQRGSAR